MAKKSQKVEKRRWIKKMTYVGLLLLLVLGLIATICFVENEGQKMSMIICEVIAILEVVIIPIWITRYEKRLQDCISHMSEEEYDEFLRHPENYDIYAK